MIKTTLVAVRDRQRLGEIAAVAGRFGLGALLTGIGLESIPGKGKEPAGSLAERTRMSLEALGPTFVKLGQILATRADLLPPEWIAELEKLQTGAAALPFDALRQSVEAALGEPPEQAFANFDPEGLAAASVAQVYRATLHDGRAIVLKARRPGIRSKMEADLRLLAQLAAIIEQASPEARRFQPRAMVRQLGEAVLDELDFTVEARNIERMAANFAGNARLVLPTIHWAWTSETLLVMDYIEGVPPTNGERLRIAGIDPRSIAALGADVVLDMVLVHGLFHADPHPGNLLCLPDDRIALLDLGMVGYISPRRREELLTFVQALASGNPAGLADTLMTWTDGATSRARIDTAAARLIARHGESLVLSAVVADFMSLLREEKLALPPDLVLVFKALVTIDGVLTRIDPTFDLSAAAGRAWLRVLGSRFTGRSLADRMLGIGLELARLADDAPRLMRALTQRLEAEPGDPSGPDGEVLAQAMITGSRWIAGAIVLAGILIAVVLMAG